MSEVVRLRNYGARDIEKGEIVAITRRGVRWLATVPPKVHGVALERIARGEIGLVGLRLTVTFRWDGPA